jgi:hypothetical protein
MKAATFGFMLLGCLALSVQAETEWCREQRSKCVNKCQPDDIYFDCFGYDGGNEHGGGGRATAPQRSGTAVVAAQCPTAPNAPSISSCR